MGFGCTSVGVKVGASVGASVGVIVCARAAVSPPTGKGCSTRAGRTASIVGVWVGVSLGIGAP